MTQFNQRVHLECFADRVITQTLQKKERKKKEGRRTTTTKKTGTVALSDLSGSNRRPSDGQCERKNNEKDRDSGPIRLVWLEQMTLR
jgi:hypothetical protein